MVSSKKSTKTTPSKEASTSTPTKVESPSSYQLEYQIQSVNEASNLYAIIRTKQDETGQYLGIYSVHDNQLLIHTNLSLNDKVSFVKWIDSVTGSANNSNNKATVASSSTIQSVPTNQLLLLAKQNGEIDIFDLKHKEVNLTLKGEHNSEITQIIQERDQLISVDKDSTLVHWNLQTGKCLKKWNVGEKGKINQIEYFSQNKRLLTAGDKIQLWELENYTVTKTFTGINESVDLISTFTKDRRVFITYSNSSKNLYLFDIESKTTAPVFKIQSSESIVKILAIRDHSSLQILALTNKGTLVGWLNTIPQSIYQGQAYDLTKAAKHSINYKLQINLDSSEEILPIKYAGINVLYNIPIISRGYSNRLGGFESLYVNYTSQKNQNIKLSRGKSDNLSIDKLSAKRKANQLSVDSNTVDGLDPIKTYTNFPHSLAIEMIQYLNSGKLPTKTLVNLISQTVKYNQLELIELHLVNIGIHQLIKILPYTSPDYIPSLFDTLMELLNKTP
ncbi:WD40 repeat-like protein [Conidiobolus coronatus NRRL 28638]|uniref:WD40 repeat-like protein n=1 Tax=Conidiobolus coronatus (strain ATCC 28846 / CBS 209.66 / NRRL 28638) TaxID=796925 RepID=A0A137P4F9_CONC2|nr:WD40 repeat-like protein [Conidiobolus coronatus NRRL 28638]|eukprot:KXN69908.1 WD40 repeat-like protein [Conidiobolus coronatus NRRL 28638]